ncbi:hypothetical protein FSP39_010278 [Pinctada imbricata]|uniref:Uncharacterized protein n=1 Tax=Pinctada imbricata TaxID=66713 RepID=A0AA88YNF1_PINIB|nr:hypothetical protein FSP39_010278 [Pinctada imbricata]
MNLTLTRFLIRVLMTNQALMERKGVDSLSSPNPDISSPEVKHTLEKVLDRKKEISSKTALLERTEVSQDKMKSSFDSDIESGLKSTDKLGLKFDGAQEKKVITPPKDTLVNLSTSNKDDMPAMLGLPSPPLPKNGSLIPTTQPSAILKSQIPQSIKHGKPGSKTMAEDGKKNMLKKPNSAFRKTKGTDVFEFKEDDSDLMEPLNFKHRHSDVDKAKSGSENKTHAGHNEMSDKASSNDNTSKPKPAFSWDIPSWDNLQKSSEEKEANGNKEDLARDNFGFDLLTKDIEDPSKREAKEKTPAPKDRQEETLEAVSSLQSLADNDKDQLSEDDALVIDESDNTTVPEAATVASPENVPPQADSETALAIQSILSFDDQEKPTEQEVPAPVEAEPIITPAENATVPTPASVPTPQSFDAVPTVPAAQPQQEVPSVPDVPIKTAEQTHVDSQVPAFETRPEALHTVRHEQNSFPEVPVAEPPIVTPTKAKKQRNNRRRKTSKSPVQGPYPSFQENSEDRFDLHNREDSDDGVLHIATESPNPETIEPQVSSIADVSNTAIDVALTDKDLQQKPLTPLHISLNGASIPEKPERQSRSRRKKNAKTAEVPQPLPETPIQHQHAETNVLAEIGSPDMASEKTDLSISDSERTDDGDASFGDEGIDGKRPRRGARKPKNYKELSGITPRTNSPRSRTSPRSPRGASPKAEIASPVVKIERLPNVAKNQREDEEQGVKDLVSNKEVPAVKEAPRRGRSSATMETGEIQHKATNVFDFDANEAEEKSESCAAPVPKRRSSSRRKKGSSEGLDGTVLTSEIKETGIKISIARQPAGLQRNNSQDHNKEKVAEAKKPVPQPCEAKPVKDIPNALPPLVIEPEKKAMKPRDMMNAEARSRSNSMVREEPISITIPKSKIIPSLPAPSTAVVTVPSTTQSTTMSNIDRIIDNVSKGIFDWNDVDDSTAQQNKLTTPLIHRCWCNG